MNKHEAAFHQEMLDTCREAAKLGYRPTRFLQMVNQDGGVATAHRLLATGGPADGLTRLWELGRLDISLEAIMLKLEYRSLFSDEERSIARERLTEIRYKASWDVERTS